MKTLFSQEGEKEGVIANLLIFSKNFGSKFHANNYVIAKRILLKILTRGQFQIRKYS